MVTCMKSFSGPPDSRKAARGFTLIELSIALVIIGLLVGGILVGQNLIRGSQLQSLGADLDLYKTAARQFRDKYRYLPGDMPNATQLWGTNPGCGMFTAGSGTQTCDGNGDELIGEMYAFWQHLALGGFIMGNYTGVQGTAALDHQIGINCPASRIDGGGFAIAHWGQQTGSAQVYDGMYKNVMFFGAQSSADLPSAGAITPEEALLFDTKIDDGYPGRGMVLSWKPFALQCANSNDPAAAIYNTASQARECALIFKTDL